MSRLAAAAAAIAFGVVAAGCGGSAPGPADVRAAFSRQGIRLVPAQVHFYGPRHDPFARVVAYLHGGTSRRTRDEYAVFTASRPGSERDELFVLVYPNRGSLVGALRGVEVQAEDLTIEAVGDVAAVFDSRAAASFRRRIDAALHAR